MKRAILTIPLLLLTACPAASPSVSNDVSAAEVALTAAEKAATLYTSLPRCPAATSLCSNPSIVAKIKSLDNTAYSAVKAAEANEALVSAAIAAIQAFETSIPSIN